MTKSTLRVWMIEPGGRGGVYHHTIRLAHALEAAGVACEIWTATDAEPPAPGLRCHLRPWIRWCRPRGPAGRVARALRLHRAANLAGFVAAHARFARELARRPPDIVHAQGGYIMALQRALLLAARRRDVPVVLTPHNAFPRSTRTAALRAFRRLLESADHLILFARSDLAALERLGGALPPRSVLPFGVLDFFSRAPGSGRALRERLGIPQEALVFLSFGHLRRDKRLDLLLDALAAGEGLGATWLLVAGDPGRDAKWLRAEISRRGLEGRVRTDLRYIEAREGGAYFDAADAVVLPYAVASQSAALYAAIACERPVVAAAVGGLAEVLTDGDTAYLVRPGDADSLADGIRRAVADGEEGRRSIAARARETVGRVSDWERSAAETRRIYESLVSRGASPDGRTGVAKP